MERRFAQIRARVLAVKLPETALENTLKQARPRRDRGRAACFGVFVRFEVLGWPRIVGAARTHAHLPQKEFQILAMLVMNRGRLVTTEQLHRELWGFEPPNSSRGNIQCYVSKLRQRIRECGAAQVIFTTELEGYHMPPDGVSADAWDFEAVCGDARAAFKVEAYQEARTLAEKALEVSKGPLAGGQRVGTYLQGWAGVVREMELEMFELVARCFLAEDRPRMAIFNLVRLVHEEPLREVFSELLMTAYSRSGMVPQAVAAYQRLRKHLDEEYGMGTSEKLRGMHVAVLRREAI